MSQVHFENRELLSVLKSDYQEKAEELRGQIEELHLERAQIEAEELGWARRHLLLTEKNRVISAFHQGTIDQDTYERLLADIDARLLQLESGLSDTNDDEESE
jgi:hypothetical protein